MDGLWLDVRFGARMVKRSPGFAVVVMLTLALGIGASTSMFAALHRIVLRPLSYAAAEELVFLHETSDDGRLAFSVSIPNLLDWRERNRSFRSLSGFRADSFNLTGEEAPFRVRGAMVSADFFETLGVNARRGRALVSRDGELSEPLSVVVSHGLWERRFGAREDLVGRSVTLDGRSFVVRGVLSPEFEFLSPTIELWVPLERFRDELPWDDRGSHPSLWVVGRLEADATMAQALSDMRRISREIHDEHDHHEGVAVSALHERSVRRARPALLALMGAVTLLLLIACVNVANLFLARCGSRARELATRTALGAGEPRLARQLIVESLMLSLAGGAVGILVAGWGVDLLKVVLPSGTPRLAELRLDPTSVLFAVAASVATAIVFGLVPLRRRRAETIVRADGVGDGSGALRRGLVVAEVALTVVLLAGAGLLLKSFLALSRVDPGFASEHRVAARIALPPGKYDGAAESIRFYRRLVESLGGRPGVEGVAASTGLPLVSTGTENWVAPAGAEHDDDGGALASVQLVTEDYFRTLGVALLAGRGFDRTDTEGTGRVVVVDELLSEQLFPGETPVGRRLFVDGTPEDPVFAEIVGVARHVRNYSLRAPEYGEVYLPLAQPPGWIVRLSEANVVVHSRRSPESVLADIRDSVARLDPHQPIYGASTMSAIVDRELETSRVNGWMSLAFALAALFLSALGLYGVVTSLVGKRTREIGLRVALGASPRDVRRSVYDEGLRFTGIGLGLGLVLLLSLRPGLGGLLHEVGAFELDVIALVVAAVLLVAAVAIGLPARRAMRLDPVQALRRD